MAANKPIENVDIKLSPMNYQRSKDVYFIFGSIMGAFQGQLNEANWKEIVDSVWQDAQTKVDILLEKLYKEQEIPIIEEDIELPTENDN